MPRPNMVTLATSAPTKAPVGWAHGTPQPDMASTANRATGNRANDSKGDNRRTPAGWRQEVKDSLSSPFAPGRRRRYGPAPAA